MRADILKKIIEFYHYVPTVYDTIRMHAVALQELLIGKMNIELR